MMDFAFNAMLIGAILLIGVGAALGTLWLSSRQEPLTLAGC